VPELRITEIFPNPSGTDKGNEWVELCAGDLPVSLLGYSIKINKRQLALSGSLEPGTCSIARTGTASLRNREAEVSLLYKGGVIQTAHTAGTAPEGFGFHIASASTFWASSTPGVATGVEPRIPPLPELTSGSLLPGLLGTAACMAGILTVLALTALRYSRDRHHTQP
jgi:hypothetical protein